MDMLPSQSDPQTSTLSSASPDKIYDVVIVGAGPVGLATAIGLRQRGIENILVIDQTRSFRQVGQGFDLLPNGLKALKYLDSQAYEKIKETHHKPLSLQQSDGEKTNSKPPGWLYKNFQGQVIRSVPVDYDSWVQDYGEGRVPIAWYNMQTTLRNLLPEHQVKANHRCINVVDEPDNSCVRIDCLSDTNIEANPYAYWVEQPQNLEINPQQSQAKSIRAKLIVGADGINSTVRKALYTDSPDHTLARPEYSGYAAIGCQEILEIPTELQTELEEKFFQGAGLLTVTNGNKSRDAAGMDEPRIILARRAESQLGYLIHLALSMELLQGQSGSSLVDLAVQELDKAGFPQVIKELVRRVSNPSKMQQRLYYIHRINMADKGDGVKKQPTWSAGRVVLVGDAAHGMPPFMGQGANQGLEDALAVVTLITKIAENHHWDDKLAIATAFEQYESLRRPLMAYIQQLTLKQFPYSSAKDWQEYNQQLHSRNFDPVLGTLV